MRCLLDCCAITADLLSRPWSTKRTWDATNLGLDEPDDKASALDAGQRSRHDPEGLRHDREVVGGDGVRERAEGWNRHWSNKAKKLTKIRQCFCCSLTYAHWMGKQVSGGSLVVSMAVLWWCDQGHGLISIFLPMLLGRFGLAEKELKPKKYPWLCSLDSLRHRLGLLGVIKRRLF